MKVYIEILQSLFSSCPLLLGSEGMNNINNDVQLHNLSLALYLNEKGVTFQTWCFCRVSVGQSVYEFVGFTLLGNLFKKEVLYIYLKLQVLYYMLQIEEQNYTPSNRLQI